MPGASPHPAPAEMTDTPDTVSAPAASGNDAGYERAELRLTRALERLDAAVTARAAKALSADEAQVRLRGDNARLEAENAKLQKAQTTVESRLDGAIARLSGLLGQEG